MRCNRPLITTIMKPLYNPLIYIILAFVLGIFMIVFPNYALHYIAIVLGLTLLIPGIIQMIRYIIEHSDKSRRIRRNSTLRFPILAALSILAGIAIICFPATVAKIFIYLLAASLVFAGIYEIVFLSLLHRRIPVGYYILPILILITGILLLLNPLSITKAVLVTIFGWGSIVYGISELIYYIKFRR